MSSYYKVNADYYFWRIMYYQVSLLSRIGSIKQKIADLTAKSLLTLQVTSVFSFSAVKLLHKKQLS